MASPTRRPALEPDLAAALHRLVATFGATQVTVTSIQHNDQRDPNPDSTPAPTQARAWQATLLEEAPCSSTCT